MKRYYIINHYITKKGNELILYKEYGTDANDYGTEPEYVKTQRLYECTSKAEMTIYLNLIGLDWDDFKIISDRMYSYENNRYIQYETDCIDIKDN